MAQIDVQQQRDELVQEHQQQHQEEETRLKELLYRSGTTGVCVHVHARLPL